MKQLRDATKGNALQQALGTILAALVLIVAILALAWVGLHLLIAIVWMLGHLR